MSASAIIPKLLAASAAILVVMLGITTYTLPNHGGVGYSDLHDLFSRALGDRQTVLPGPPASLPIRLLPDSAGSSAPPAVVPGSGLDSTQPQRWTAQAVHHDSTALRGWLGAAVLATATVDGDTVRTTLWRLTLHSGCPLVSRLHATSAGGAQGGTRIVQLTGDCPGKVEE